MMVELGTSETSQSTFGNALFNGNLRGGPSNANPRPIFWGSRGMWMCVGHLHSHNLGDIGDIPNEYPSDIRCTT